MDLRAAGCRLVDFSGNREHRLIDLAVARRLECPRLVLLTEKLDSQGVAIPPPRPLSDDARMASLCAGLESAVALADAADVTLVVEPLNTRIDHPGYSLNHSQPAFDAVRAIGSPRLKVLYDIYHMHVMGDDTPATIAANLPLIEHFHVADAPGRHEPGTGEIPYRDIARLLRDSNYDGCLGLECYPRGDSQAAVAAFREDMG